LTQIVKLIKRKSINEYASYMPLGRGSRHLEERNASDFIGWPLKTTTKSPRTFRGI
jgi:hypothetical protein